VVYNVNVLFFPRTMYSVISTNHTSENLTLMAKQPEHKDQKKKW